MPRATTTSTKRSSRSSAKTDDAIAFLKSEHRNVEELFKRFEGLGDTAHKSRQTTVGKMIEALSKHAAIEQVLYPAVRARVEGEQDDLVLEALEEHHVVKLTLRELESMPSTTSVQGQVTCSPKRPITSRRRRKELSPERRASCSHGPARRVGSKLRDGENRLQHGTPPLAPTARPPTSSPTRCAAPLDAAAKVAARPRRPFASRSLTVDAGPGASALNR